MGYVVLGAWVIQAIVGAILLGEWLRHARGAGRGPLLVHISLVVLYLAPWVAFVVTGAAWWAWIAVAVLTVALSFGDVMMVRRARRLQGRTRPGMRDYGGAIGMVFTGKMPRRVVFHALLAPVVYFGSLGLAIAATVAPAS
ncbi:hypothetical protein [Microbacterium invictum]|uniref:Uncharacterized protein n=1 Tax=Microbacterium invictum TaxID=515415 RepID=A0AA40SLT9_9MICO|nr:MULTISPECIES: hypothetical protein [Microbacterium]MBB4138507.1 hypothetical protein [Microbacterium invictum]